MWQFGGQYCLPQNTYWDERIPYQRNYIDYVAVPQIEYVAVTKPYTDYMTIRNEINYQPFKRLESYYESVPVEHLERKIDYIPQQYSFVVAESTVPPPTVNQPISSLISSRSQKPMSPCREPNSPLICEATRMCPPGCCCVSCCWTPMTPNSEGNSHIRSPRLWSPPLSPCIPACEREYIGPYTGDVYRF